MHHILRRTPTRRRGNPERLIEMGIEIINRETRDAEMIGGFYKMQFHRASE